ncbi:hypothetical protein CPC08DRAFT_695851 [Agrocybe pediades]|nr:hypothetical protein CPC08DRAFT_695851 [Agrocybe pediades]
MQFEEPKDGFSLDSMDNRPQYIHHPSMSAYRQVQYARNENPVASTSSNPNSQVSGASLTGGANSGLPQTPFRAPAHKHAHHLHSIPPREKSTRTLIIDHMLWVHGRTRFAQARAELGMTDRTGGPSSPNYVHRSRPESYEEEDEEGSEGEEIVALKARAGGPGHPHNDDEDERLGRQDLALARSLRLRAEGLEKVVISMLEQPPPIHPINDEDILTPPTSPKIKPTSPGHPHRLPNGVRLRLALGTIINDLFARQAPPPPYRHTRVPGSKISTPPDHSPSVVPSPSDLPDALATLAPVSGAFAPLPQSSYAHNSSSSSSRSMRSPPYGDYQSSYSSSGHQNYNQSGSPPRTHMQYQSMPQQPLGPPPPPSRPQRPHPSARTRSLYAVGADPSTANSPPAFRCPRHLHTGCEICVEAKSPPRQTGSSNSRGRAGSFSTDRTSSTNSWKAMPGGVGPGGGGITGWQDGSGIGSGLLRPGVKGSVLRRKISDDVDSTAGAGNTKLSKLIPRFIRLSALVAAELGREARGEEDGVSEDGRERREGSSGAGPSSPAVSRTPVPQNQNQSQGQGQDRMYEFALRPSPEWYMLLAGLLTRAVLEGYLTAGWTGIQAVQCLLLVGLGINENAWKNVNEDGFRQEDQEEEDEYVHLEPDEMPSLVDAIRILFPNLRQNGMGGKSKGEEEYEVEMFERLKRFYDIPASTPDCATHMEDLAWQYPAEPVERAAVRFCEAIAKWRGKPELETYKKKPAPPPLDVPSTPGGSAVMTIESLVHSNPTSPVMQHGAPGGSGSGGRRRRRLMKPSIDVYFVQAASGSAAGGSAGRSRAESGSWSRAASTTSPSPNMGYGSNKRYRDSDDVGRMEPAKRMYT